MRKKEILALFLYQHNSWEKKKKRYFITHCKQNLNIGLRKKNIFNILKRVFAHVAPFPIPLKII